MRWCYIFCVTRTPFLTLGIILGLPVFAYYYVVFNVEAKTVAFSANAAPSPKNPSPPPSLRPAKGTLAPAVQPTPIPSPDFSNFDGLVLTGNGATLSLDAANFDGGNRLAINVAPADTSTPLQRLLLDTGSSTLAFCVPSVATPVAALRTEYFSCNRYGSGSSGYYGYFYRGSLNLENDLTLSSSYYSVHNDSRFSVCLSP